MDDEHVAIGRHLPDRERGINSCSDMQQASQAGSRQHGELRGYASPLRIA
jgi:hypothetical protein